MLVRRGERPPKVVALKQLKKVFAVCLLKLEFMSWIV
jgi:hypothetical protein